MIRLAREDDFDQVLDLCAAFWLETCYDEKFDRDHTLNLVKMAYDHGLLAVLDLDGVVGFTAAVKSPLMGSPDAFMGTELAWWINPEHRKGRNGLKLMKFIEDLAFNAGVKYWNMVSMQSSSPETANKIYEKMGYTLNEMVYTKVM